MMALLLVSSLLGSCGLLKGGSNSQPPVTKTENGNEGEQGKAQEEMKAAVRVAGEIASVNSEESYVLIRRYSRGGGFGRGTVILSVSPEGKTASLKLSGERIGKFHAADIQQGSPAKGDVVVVRILPGGAQMPSTPLPDHPESSQKRPWLENFSVPGM